VVSNVIYARIEETLMILAKQLEKSGFKNQLGAGVVLTGGMTKLEGIREIAAPIFDNMPIRIARPRNIEGAFESLKDPAFATAFGLIRYGAGEYTLYEIDSNKNLRSRFEGGSVRTRMPQPMDPQEEMGPIARRGGVGEENSEIADIMLKHPEDGGVKGSVQKMWRWATQLF